MSQDKAETGRLQELLARVGSRLDQFLRFEHPEAISRQETWRAALEQPVPQQGVGIDQVEGFLQAVLRIGNALVDEQA